MKIGIEHNMQNPTKDSHFLCSESSFSKYIASWKNFLQCTMSYFKLFNVSYPTNSVRASLHYVLWQQWYLFLLGRFRTDNSTCKQTFYSPLGNKAVLLGRSRRSWAPWCRRNSAGIPRARRSPLRRVLVTMFRSEKSYSRLYTRASTVTLQLPVKGRLLAA